MVLTFVSYSGAFPNLCSGTLVLAIDGVPIEFPYCSLWTGGSAHIGKNGEEFVSKGKWCLRKWPENFPKELKKEATELVNKNVHKGCCGGCI